MMFDFTGHFPWLIRLVQYGFRFSEAGKASDYMQKVVFGLIKARRENEQTGKVFTVPSFVLARVLKRSYYSSCDAYTITSK